MRVTGRPVLLVMSDKKIKKCLIDRYSCTHTEKPNTILGLWETRSREVMIAFLLLVVRVRRLLAVTVIEGLICQEGYTDIVTKELGK